MIHYLTPYQGTGISLVCVECGQRLVVGFHELSWISGAHLKLGGGTLKR